MHVVHVPIEKSKSCWPSCGPLEHLPLDMRGSVSAEVCPAYGKRTSAITHRHTRARHVDRASRDRTVLSIAASFLTLLSISYLLCRSESLTLSKDLSHAGPCGSSQFSLDHPRDA